MKSRMQHMVPKTALVLVTAFFLLNLAGCENTLLTKLKDIKAVAESPVIQVSKEGTGTLASSGVSLDYGVLRNLAGQTISLTIHNTGKSPLTVEGGKIEFSPQSGTEAGVFSVNSAPASAIPAGGSAKLVLNVAPASLGTQTVSLIIPSNDLTQSRFACTVTCVWNSAAKEITRFAFGDIFGTISGNSIAVTLPHSMDSQKYSLAARFVTTGVSVTVGGVAQLSGSTAHDFSQPVIYTVTAADGSTKDYTVTITVSQYDLPTVTTTNAPTGITTNSATGGGSGISAGGGTITERGLCWSLSPNPNIMDNTVKDPLGGTSGFSTCQMTGLAAGTIYYVRAYALSQAGFGYGPEQYFVTVPGPAAVPSLSPVGGVGHGGEMDLSWSAVTGADKYDVYCSLNPADGTGGTSTKKVSDTTLTTARITGLTQFTTYYFWVVAKNVNGSASPSASSGHGKETGVRVTGFTLAFPSGTNLAPGGTATITATPIPADATLPTVTWASSAIGIATVDAASGLVSIVAHGNATITATSTEPGSSVQASLSLDGPTGLTAVPADPRKLALSWTAKTGASGYRIYYKTASNVDKGSSMVASSGTSCTLTGLTNWTTYYVKVAAVVNGCETLLQATALSATPVHEGVYILDYNNARMVVSSVRNPAAAGAWTLGPLTDYVVGAGPSMMAQDASLKFVYESNSANTANGGIAGYSIYPSDGLVSALVTNTDINYRMEGIGIASPNGAVGQQFLYATNQGDTGAAGLYVYSINNGTGALTRIETVATDNNPRALVVSPAGDYLYLTNIGSNTVCSYSINPSTGHPTKIGSYWTGTNPYKLAISPDGKNLYVPNFGGVSYSSYSIASGALTTIQDKAASGANPTSFAVHPSGSFVYGACAASGATSSINQYSRNAVTGVLTPIGAGYVLCDAYCNQVAVAPSGQYLLAACSSGKTIELFSIDQATGALTYQNKWQFSSATSPASVFIAKLP